jgi:hypothetical protein
MSTSLSKHQTKDLEWRLGRDLLSDVQHGFCPARSLNTSCFVHQTTFLAPVVTGSAAASFAIVAKSRNHGTGNDFCSAAKK